MAKICRHFDSLSICCQHMGVIIFTLYGAVRLHWSKTVTRTPKNIIATGYFPFETHNIANTQPLNALNMD